jgi:hypothetical protein
MPPAKRKSAFFSATQEAQKKAESENTVKPSSSETVAQLQGDTATQSQSETVLQSQRDTVGPSSSVTGLPSSSDTVAPSQSETVIEQQSRKVKPLNSTTAKKDTKVSFYLTSEQEQKLDDLAYEHKKHTGKRINRNDIVRHLVDHCSIEDLQNIE